MPMEWGLTSPFCTFTDKDKHRQKCSFSPWLFTSKEYARSPDLLPDLAALQSNIDAQRDLGFLKGPIDVRKYADLSIVREAAARLR